jgi:hypothetical protein
MALGDVWSLMYLINQTDKQYLLLYVILPFENASFQLNSPQSAHGYTHGPGEGKGPKTMLIRFRLAIRIDAGIAW